MLTSWSDYDSMEYHEKQWRESKQSTVEFYIFLEDELSSCSNVIDVACGGGAVTNYFARQNKNCFFTGLDIDSNLITFAQNKSEASNFNNLEFRLENIYELNARKNVDMVTCIATLSWLTDWELAVNEIVFKLNPKFLGVTSLFYEGEISTQCKIIEHDKNREVFYNTFSIPQFEKTLLNIGYKAKKIKPFIINVDIPKPALPKMGTYTLRALNETGFERIQISGPLLMNWWFMLFERV